MITSWFDTIVLWIAFILITLAAVGEGAIWAIRFRLLAGGLALWLLAVVMSPFTPFFNGLFK